MKNFKDLTDEELADCITAAKPATAQYLEHGELRFHWEAIMEAARRLRSARTVPKKESKLAELAGNLEFIKLKYKGEMGCRWIDKAQRILRTVNKAFEPVDPTAVKPSLPDGRIHLRDILEADTVRACDILIKCHAIAEEV